MGDLASLIKVERRRAATIKNEVNDHDIVHPSHVHVMCSPVVRSLSIGLGDKCTDKLNSFFFRRLVQRTQSCWWTGTSTWISCPAPTWNSN